MNEIRITIEGLTELTEAVRVLAGLTGGQQASASVPMPETSHAAYTAPASTWNAPVGMQSYEQMAVPSEPAPAGTGMQQSAVPTVPVTVPTTAMPQTYTIEQLQVAAAGLSSMGKMPQVMGILQQFGIQAMTELQPERYGEFAIALREAGAQI